MASFSSSAFSTSAFSASAFDFGETPPPTGFTGAITGPAATIGPGMDGGVFPLTDVSPNHNETGGVAIQFVMSNDWVGSIEFQCRSAVIDAWIDDIDFVGPWPFRAFYLDGAGSTGAMLSGGSAVVQNSSNVLVPTSGNMLAIAVTCLAGSATMCYQPVSGSTEP